MVEESEEGQDQQVDIEDEEDGGGPVKSFLEHLEDLRWTLIKCFSAIIVSMLVCLVAGNYLVALLVWPLKNAERFLVRHSDRIPVLLGTNVIGRIDLSEMGLSELTNAAIKTFRLMPRKEGTNYVLTLEADQKQTEMMPPTFVVIKNYGPIEGIMVALRLALFGGLLLASPFVFFFVGQFVLPALKIHEKKILYNAVGIGSILFFIGVAFCYFIIAAVALFATVQFSQWLGFGADEWRADAYISFMCKFMLGTGIGFELPVVILTLVKIGLIDYKQLVGFRSYAIVGNLVLAAFATPSGDPVTMLLMAAPMQLLYEISVIIAWHWARQEKKRENQV